MTVAEIKAELDGWRQKLREARQDRDAPGGLPNATGGPGADHMTYLRECRDQVEFWRRELVKARGHLVGFTQADT